jgi:hypothetical protein
MARKPTPVDHAFGRCRLLANVVAREYERARAHPTDERYVDLGVTELGAKKAEAQRKIQQAFDDLVALVDHLTILDMAAAFEGLSNAQIATAVGEARKTLEGKHRNSALAWRKRLVREPADCQGLSNITNLIGPDLDERVKKQLESVRQNRNQFAHRTALSNPPTILQKDARDALNAAVALLQPV